MEYKEIELLKQSAKSAVHLVRGGQDICLPKLKEAHIYEDKTVVIEGCIEGRTLGAAELSGKRFRQVVRRLCSVLEFLRGKGIIYRDIKPSNCLIQFLKGLLFILILLAGLKAAVLLLYPSNEIVRTWQRFYALEKGEVELLVVGSSHAYSTFDTSVIFQTTGMESYILATNSQNAVQAYFNVKEALHYQRPKAIILEAFSLDNNNNWRYGDTPDRDWKKESNIDGMRFGLTKLEAVMEQYERENWSYALLPIARCHGNWENIVTVGSNLRFLTGGMEGFSSFRPSWSVMSAETAEQYAQAAYNPAEWVISETNELHFRKLAALCREEGIPFYVVMAPMYDVYIQSMNYDSCTDKVAALAESEGVSFLDCNLYYDEIGLTAEDFEDVFNTYHHLNGSGAEKVSRFVMETLYGRERD